MKQCNASSNRYEHKVLHYIKKHCAQFDCLLLIEYLITAQLIFHETEFGIKLCTEQQTSRGSFKSTYIVHMK